MKNNWIKSLIFSLALLFAVMPCTNAATIIETTLEDEYDTIENNSIIVGVTKFESGEILTAGKVALATYNYMLVNSGESNVEVPKIYYYLEDAWYEIDDENNTTLVEDTSLVEKLDIYFVNNEEKILEIPVEYIETEGYELSFKANIESRNSEIRYENNIIYVPASIEEVKVISTATSGDVIEVETWKKEARNSSTFMSLKNEITGEDGNFKYVMLENGKIQITRWLASGTDVVIPAEYDGYQVYSVGNPEATTASAKRFNIFGETSSTKNTTVKSVTISEGIEVIGLAAFSGCTGLTCEIKLPTTLKELQPLAFNGCKNITGTPNFPDNITVIGRSAFQNCSKLKGTLTLPKNLKVIEKFAFNGCSGFTGDIKIPEGTTTIEQYAFQNCTGFNGILTLPSTLEVIEDGAFNHCSKLTNTSVTIPKSVIRIGMSETEGTHVFYDFANNTMKEYIVEEGNTKFKAIDGVLYNIEGTRMIAYPSSRQCEVYEMPEGVTIIDELSFSRAGSPWHLRDTTGTIKKLILPNSYVLNTELPDNYLNQGSNLAVGIYKYTGIRNVEVKEDNPNYKSVDGILYSKDGTTLWYVPVLKDGDVFIQEGVISIKSGALYTGWDRIYLDSITIPASVTNIEDTELAELAIFKKNGITVIFEEGSPYQYDASGNVVKVQE